MNVNQNFIRKEHPRMIRRKKEDQGHVLCPEIKKGKIRRQKKVKVN